MPRLLDISFVRHLKSIASNTRVLFTLYFRFNSTRRLVNKLSFRVLVIFCFSSAGLLLDSPLELSIFVISTFGFLVSSISGIVDSWSLRHTEILSHRFHEPSTIRFFRLLRSLRFRFCDFPSISQLDTATPPHDASIPGLDSSTVRYPMFRSDLSTLWHFDLLCFYYSPYVRIFAAL